MAYSGMNSTGEDGTGNMWSGGSHGGENSIKYLHY